MLILWSLLGFLVAITILVAIHEFGHFWVARLAGVKVLRFSIGFGKPIFTLRDKKGTEFVVALIPFGGYVRMLDEREAHVAPEEQHLAFNRQSVWRRMAVIVAGPLFNILFAIFAYWLMFVIGIKTVAPIIGSVEPQSIAAKANLKPLQEIVMIDDTAVISWPAVQMALLPHIGEQVKVKLKTKHINTQHMAQHRLDLKHWRYQGSEPDLIASLGILPYSPAIPAVIGRVNPDSPAANAGLRAGDKMIGVNGKAVTNWAQVVAIILHKPHQTVTITVQRKQQQLTLAVKVGAKKRAEGKRYGYLGVSSSAVQWPKALLRVQRFGFIAALPIAMKKTWQMTSLTCKMLAKMVIGEISTKGLSGPIGIAQGAGVSARMGMSYYLNFLALVSIGLAIINILPIPILDGGQFVYCVVELFSKKPVSERVQEIGMRVGIIILLSVMLLAIYNDVSRL